MNKYNNQRNFSHKLFLVGRHSVLVCIFLMVYYHFTNQNVNLAVLFVATFFIAMPLYFFRKEEYTEK